MSNPTKYKWPKSGEPIQRECLQVLSDLGIRGHMFKQPNCWECGALTGVIEKTHQLHRHLEYEPYCQACKRKDRMEPVKLPNADAETTRLLRDELRAAIELQDTLEIARIRMAIHEMTNKYDEAEKDDW